jgi:hypothetical protein
MYWSKKKLLYVLSIEVFRLNSETRFLQLVKSFKNTRLATVNKIHSIKLRHSGMSRHVLEVP